MKYNFCLLSIDEAKDRVKLGYNYAMKKQLEWRALTDVELYLTAGYLKGTDFVVFDNTPYLLNRSYILADKSPSEMLFICEESPVAQDKKEFN